MCQLGTGKARVTDSSARAWDPRGAQPQACQGYPKPQPTECQMHQMIDKKGHRFFYLKQAQMYYRIQTQSWYAFSSAKTTEFYFNVELIMAGHSGALSEYRPLF